MGVGSFQAELDNLFGVNDPSSWLDDLLGVDVPSGLCDLSGVDDLLGGVASLEADESLVGHSDVFGVEGFLAGLCVPWGGLVGVDDFFGVVDL